MRRIALPTKESRLTCEKNKISFGFRAVAIFDNDSPVPLLSEPELLETYSRFPGRLAPAISGTAEKML